MPNVNISPNMLLPVPIPTVAPGPEWAQDLYNLLYTQVDQHDHSSGKGVPVTPQGININLDLPFNNNDATQLRSTRFTSQGSPLPAVSPDLECLYVSGVDLYYNDGSGNQIRITQSGSIAGASGSITGLVPPASATYVSLSSTFVWQSNTNTAAAMDGGPVTIRQILANAHGITLQSPNSLANDYSLTLPSALPASLQIATIDASGNVGAALTPDNTTIQFTSGSLPSTLQVKDSSITPTKQSNLNIATSSNVTSASITAGSLATIATTASLTVSGHRPVMIAVVPSTTAGQITYSNSGAQVYVQFSASGPLDLCIVSMTALPSTGMLSYVYLNPPAGTTTYSVQMQKVAAGTDTLGTFRVVAYEF